jgi:hypothetical protein
MRVLRIHIHKQQQRMGKLARLECKTSTGLAKYMVPFAVCGYDNAFSLFEHCIH